MGRAGGGELCIEVPGDLHHADWCPARVSSLQAAVRAQSGQTPVTGTPDRLQPQEKFPEVEMKRMEGSGQRPSEAERPGVWLPLCHSWPGLVLAALSCRC